MAYNSITQLLPDIYPEGEEVLEFVCAHAQHATKDWLCLPQLIYRNSGIHTDPRQNSPEPGGGQNTVKQTCQRLLSVQFFRVFFFVSSNASSI